MGEFELLNEAMVVLWNYRTSLLFSTEPSGLSGAEDSLLATSQHYTITHGYLPSTPFSHFPHFYTLLITQVSFSSEYIGNRGTAESSLSLSQLTISSTPEILEEKYLNVYMELSVYLFYPQPYNHLIPNRGETETDKNVII